MSTRDSDCSERVNQMTADSWALHRPVTVTAMTPGAEEGGGHGSHSDPPVFIPQTLKRENARTKALRYLIEGRIMIRSVGPQGVRAHVRGQGHVYNVAYEAGGGWTCSCPAKTPYCCHVIATGLVVAVPQGGA